ncbi:MAG TPA: hypothetical protein DEH78_19790 [Solibacterales bacterium]|nr:hypothetical protein [Bryobacterales bacterium]
MRLLALALPCLLTTALSAQVGLTLPRSGNTQRSAVTQFIGPVKVSIEYGSPAVHGPDGADRRGQIWGKLVPYGLTDLGFGHRKPSPWRAGADENTVFETSHNVLIEGKPLAAGRYGLHMIAGPDEWTLVFSRNSTSWGSFFYEESEDALRVTTKPSKHDYREWLTYEFTSRKPAEATAEMQWEDLAVGWKIAAPDIDEVYLSKLREELRNTAGFTHLGWNAAAQYCLQIGKNYEEGLAWAEAAVSKPFVGRAEFSTLSTKAQLLERLGRDSEAKEAMRAALNHPSARPVEIHQYGRQLLAAKRVAEAMEVFQLNAKRNGDEWPVHVGLARGYAATGDKAKALEHARKALAQAPDEVNRKNLQNMVKEFGGGS